MFSESPKEDSDALQIPRGPRGRGAPRGPARRGAGAARIDRRRGQGRPGRRHRRRHRHGAAGVRSRDEGREGVRRRHRASSPTPSGTYRFPALTPGRYEITATLSGFAPAKVQNIDLRLGQQLNINLTLQPGGVAETVQVVAESPLIAITQSARSTSIRADEIDKMPKGRDFVTLVTQASGSEHGGQVRHERDHDRRLVRRREPLDHRRRRVHRHGAWQPGQDDGHRLRRGGPGQVLRLHRRVRRLHRRRDQRPLEERQQPVARRCPSLLSVRLPGLRPPPDAAAQADERPRGGVRHLPEGRVQPRRAGLQPQRADRPRQGLVLRGLHPAVPAARPDGHVQVRRLDPDLRPGLPVEPPVHQRDRPARAAVPLSRGVQPEQREVRGHAARSGRYRQPHRELRRQRRLPELVGVRDDRLHAEQQGVHEPARRVLEQRLLHRGRLRRGPGHVLRLVGRSSRSAGRVAAAQRLRERADEHRQHPEQATSASSSSTTPPSSSRAAASTS